MPGRIMTRRAALALGAASAIASLARTARAADEQEIAVTGEVSIPATLTAADLAAMPQTEVSGSWSDAEDGAPYTAKGPLLYDVIAATQPKVAEETEARMAVIVTGNDGYEAVFSWVELSPAGAAAPVVLATEFNGKPLETQFQPAWIISSGDAVSLRSVFSVARIELRDLGAGAGMATPAA